MVSPTELEPRPLLGGQVIAPDWPTAPVVLRFRKPRHAPKIGFFDALYARRSGPCGKATENGLGAILYHSMRLRERRHDGRFGTWESRSAPSAGGIHGIRPFVFPCEEVSPGGLYDPTTHGLIGFGNDPQLRRRVHSHLRDLDLQSEGYFVQFVADTAAYASRYENSGSLVLRDAGALLSVICMVAAALDLSCRPLGHLGGPMVEAAGFSTRYQGVGGIMI